MKKMLLSMLSVILIGMGSCSDDKTPRLLFQGENLVQWNTRGDATLRNKLLVLNEDASVALKKGNYTNFELNVAARTIDNGKGFIAFHTDDQGKKGYRVVINNDLESHEWWKKTGSLLAVRNLTKSTVKTNEWFDMQIRVDGKAITVSLNGFPVVEYTEPATPWRIAENTSQILSAGTFVIQSTEGTLEIKSVSVTPLSEQRDVTKQQASAIDETTDPVIRLHQENFPVLDYHVHLKGLTAEQAATQARKYGINYALAPNCGIGFPITNDEEVIQYLEAMEGQPFIQAMQGEGREWPVTFSKEVRDRFDYVFTDAMTFIDTKGRRTRLWIPEEVFVEDEQQYMDLIVQKIVDVMQEPMDVYVNPTFLPDVMSDRYDDFWTEERMDKVITAMVKTGKALEINNRYKIPNQAFIQKAKDAGLKFTFGTNNADGDFGKLEYCIRMKEACGLTAEDMYQPDIRE
ncbi:MAG: family 16 glycoside hydrolase [Proteiniphilum sp.]